ncbi:Synembryn-B [Acipenser ruthenus]|uniref:Synembryn n=1 Tax=Acipenser ruthenus TaxID=7906 RepID=A0A444UDX3_ACIRT|nr:Synembryn-B [Acipenser ruthenus]
MDLNTVLSKVESIESSSEEEIESVLREYNREKLCEGLIRILGKNVQASCQTMCLETLRILSRDKKVLGPVATKQGMLVLAQLAALQGTGESVPEILEVGLVVEALKCLCNVIFNSVAAQQLSAELSFPSGLCARLRMYTGQGLSHEVALFSLRLLFLLSALRTDVRSCLRQELKAVGLLIEILEHILSIKWVGKYEVATDLEAPPLPLEDNERTMEALKTLFNLTLSDFNDEDGAHQLRLITAIMRHVLMIKTQTEDKTEELHSHAINLLSNIPVLCLGVMISVQSRGGIEEYSGKNMDVIQVLLDFMVKRIDKGSNFKEGLTPVFSLMTESARHHRDIRKYIKAQVLPPLKDVKNRRIRTDYSCSIYTGYGNAAGLLAARGLLAGGRGGGQYSEDEDSDTEEYKSVKPFINPITGHVEEPMPNPIEEMTEEQKEYEALKLVNMFDQLSRQQIIQPMGVKQDGTIAPLAEAISQCNIESCSSDSD